MNDLNLPTTFDDAHAALVPRAIGQVPYGIRGMQARLTGAASAMDAGIDVAGEYALGAYLDLPTADVPVSPSMLERWGVDIRTVLDAAFERHANMQAESQRIGKATRLHSVPLVAHMLKKAHATSQLVDGTPVLIVPDIGNAILAPADDELALRTALAMIESVIGDTAKPVSVQPLVLTANGWAPWAWPPSLGSFAERVGLNWEAIMYARGKPFVEAIATNEYGIDAPFAAKLQLAKRADGSYLTMTSIVESAEQLVPRAERYALVRDNGALAEVSRTDLFAVPGLLEPVPWAVPSYWRVTRFPVEFFG